MRNLKLISSLEYLSYYSRELVNAAIILFWTNLHTLHFIN